MRERNENRFVFIGTFAVISLMTAQGIESVIKPSNQTSFSDPLIINDKITAATTLALLVGFVQVNSIDLLFFEYIFCC